MDILTQTLQNTTLNNEILNNIFSKKNNSNVVLNILQDRIVNGGKEYLVTWYNNTTEWIPANNMSDYTIKVHNIMKLHNLLVEQSQITSSENQITKQAFIYLRTSTNNNISIDTQKYYCLKYCTEHQISIQYYAEDNGVSGRFNGKIMKNLNNELGFWLPYLTSNNIMVLYSIDRLGRHAGSMMSILDKLITKGISIHFVKENIIFSSNTQGYQKTIIYEQCIQAQNVSDLTSEKIRNSLNRLRHAGHYIGNPSYGFKIKRNASGIRKKIIDETQKNIICEICNIYNNTPITTHTTPITSYIAKIMNARNLYYKNNKFTTKNVRYLLNKYLHHLDCLQ